MESAQFDFLHKQHLGNILFISVILNFLILNALFHVACVIILKWPMKHPVFQMLSMVFPGVMMVLYIVLLFPVYTIPAVSELVCRSIHMSLSPILQMAYELIHQILWKFVFVLI